MGLIRSHYVGRTFIEPQESIRHFGVRLKLNPVESIIRGKRVLSRFALLGAAILLPLRRRHRDLLVVR
jgi:hypothetical protein